MTKTEQAKKRKDQFKPSDISEDQAFLDYSRMEKPHLRDLQAMYQRTMKNPPSYGTICRWSTKHQWQLRLDDLKKKALMTEAARSAGLVTPGDGFVARDELRGLSANLIKVLNDVAAGNISTQARELLEKAPHFARLADCARECIKLSEIMKGSVADKDAEEKKAAPVDHKTQHAHYLALALNGSESPH